MPEQLNRILVVNVNWLGDVVFSSPVFRALRQNFPQAHIACFAVPRVREVLECIPEIDEIIVYDEKEKHRWLFGKCQIISQLRKGKFDAAFLLHRSFTRALLVFLAGISRRIGYEAKGRGFLLTHKIKPDMSDCHRSDVYLRVITAFGISVADKTNMLSLPSRVTIPQEFQRENLIANSDHLFVVIHPGANWNLKRWPVANFSLLIKRLRQECNASVVLSGGPDDRDLAKQIVEETGEEILIFTGKTSLHELMALMTQADVFISADSGPLHLANSLGKSVVGIFGPTHPSWTAPRGSGKSVVVRREIGCNTVPCYHLRCPDNTCMQAVTVDEVLDAVKQIRNK